MLFCDQMPENLKEEVFCYIIIKDTIYCGKVMEVRVEASTVRKQRAMDAGVQITFCFLSSLVPAEGQSLTIRVVLPS